MAGQRHLRGRVGVADDGQGHAGQVPDRLRDGLGLRRVAARGRGDEARGRLATGHQRRGQVQVFELGDGRDDGCGHGVLLQLCSAHQGHLVEDHPRLGVPVGVEVDGDRLGPLRRQAGGLDQPPAVVARGREANLAELVRGQEAHLQVRADGQRVGQAVDPDLGAVDLTALRRDGLHDAQLLGRVVVPQDQRRFAVVDLIGLGQLAQVGQGAVERPADGHAGLGQAVLEGRVLEQVGGLRGAQRREEEGQGEQEAEGGSHRWTILGPGPVTARTRMQPNGSPPMCRTLPWAIGPGPAARSPVARATASASRRWSGMRHSGARSASARVRKTHSCASSPSSGRHAIPLSLAHSGADALRGV